MCFAAVYLDHHWVFDVVLGSLYAVVISTLMRRLFRTHLRFELPGAPAHGVANEGL
jgi:membrane-associated phospholipid phosphatase